MSDSDEIYRQAALDQYLAAREFGSVTRVSPPWTWAILLISLAAAGAAFLVSIVTKIEVTDRAPGVVTASGSVVALVSVVPGDEDVVHLRLAGRTVPGRIVAVDRRPAAAHEMRAAWGETLRMAGPLHALEIAVPPGARASIPMKTGMPVDVRMTRRDRVIFILFAPSRRWLDG